MMAFYLVVPSGEQMIVCELCGGASANECNACPKNNNKLEKNKMVVNEYKLSSQPTVEGVLSDPTSTYWLKNAVTNLLEKDIVNSLKDVEVLHAILVDRFNRITAR